MSRFKIPGRENRDRHQLEVVAGLVAPTLSIVLGGGPLQKSAIITLSQWVLGRPDGTASEITRAISVMTVDQMAPIRKKDRDYLLSLLDQNIDFGDLRPDLVVLAQKRQDYNAVFRNWMSFFIITASIYATILAIFIDTPGLKDPLAAAVVGAGIKTLWDKAAQVIRFHYGEGVTLPQSERVDAAKNQLAQFEEQKRQIQAPTGTSTV